MMEFLKFTFQDFTHFLGVCVLILVAGEVLCSILDSVRGIVKR